MGVDVYGDQGERLYGFCALKSSVEDRRPGQKMEGRLDIPKRQT
jgi:hypothetical protein